MGRQTKQLRNAKGSAVTADFDPLYAIETPREPVRPSKAERRKAWRGDQLKWPWEPLVRENELTAWDPLVEPGPSVSADSDDKTYCNGARRRARYPNDSLRVHVEPRTHRARRQGL